MLRRVQPKREHIVVSVGGSLIVPDQIDVAFLKSFRELIVRKVREGYFFYIITGGGKTARRYQEAGKEVHGEVERGDVDWLGIHATRMNAHLLRTIFSEDAQSRIVKNPTRSISTRCPIVIGAGWKPGWSTDYCAVMAAKKLGAKRMVNLSNIDGVYDKDPKKNQGAKMIEKTNWHDFRELIPKDWDPGLSSPFDPVAAREAERMKLEVAIMNGAHLEEFDHYISGTPFKGSVIS